VFLEHSALQEDDGSVTIESANLTCVEIADVKDLREGRHAGEHQDKSAHSRSKNHRTHPFLLRGSGKDSSLTARPARG
jgi:hypothetical protein